MSAAVGRRLRDAGIRQVLMFEESWLENYRANCVFWFERKPLDFRFTGEALRHAARKLGTSEPNHFNAWAGGASSLIRTWLKSGQIEVVGFRNAESPLTRAHSLREYRKK